MKEILLTQAQIDKYWMKVDINGPGNCWIWTGFTNKSGYGHHGSVNGTVLAHRVAVHLDGRNPDKKVVMHTCDNPSCVNPKHLILGTQLDNIQDMINKKRQACGESKSFSILTEAQVLDIQARHIKGKSGVKNSGNTKLLADEYGVTYGTIYSITHGLRWKHLS